MNLVKLCPFFKSNGPYKAILCKVVSREMNLVYTLVILQYLSSLLVYISLSNIAVPQQDDI